MVTSLINAAYGLVFTNNLTNEWRYKKPKSAGEHSGESWYFTLACGIN